MWYIMPLRDARELRRRELVDMARRPGWGRRWPLDRFTVTELARFLHVDSEGMKRLLVRTGVVLRKENGHYRRLTRAEVYRILVEKHRRTGARVERAALRVEDEHQRQATTQTDRRECDE